ncbi:MAG: hypothetical protein HKP61_01905 [Dactylosporangium sp.]|nr:hypothetical protein [Dactylosporangium sp.]NNJ59718.1 hypothetical protein [Dactylosporangium sp.]
MHESVPGGHRRRLPRWILPAASCALLVTVTTVVLMVRTGNSACAAPVAATPVAAGPLAAGESRSGKATHYDATGGGNCSFEASGPGLYVALSPSEYAAGAACGGYLDVTNARGTVRVKVTDQCPGCPAGHIDLSKEAFARLGALATGELAVTYRTVVNPALPGPITVRVKDGASRWWFAARIDNHGNPLSRVEVKTASGWAALDRTDYNYWLKPDGAGPGPFTIRIVDSRGHTAAATGVSLAPEQVQRTSVRMYATSIPSSDVPRSPSPARSDLPPSEASSPEPGGGGALPSSAMPSATRPRC